MSGAFLLGKKFLEKGPDILTPFLFYFAQDRPRSLFETCPFWEIHNAKPNKDFL